MSQSSARDAHLRLAVGLSFALGALLACSDEPAGPGEDHRLPQSPAVVSASLISSGPGGLAAVRLGVAYVSMPSGTDPSGVSVTVQDVRGGPLLSVPMTDGGFDPIAVTAQPDDTLLITVHRVTGASVKGYALVPAHSKPVVVRTSPPTRKTDVPLNSIIQIVFSEPMDSSSVAGALHLKFGGTDVPGVVMVAPVGGAILSAWFIPTTSLAIQTAYQLDITTAATGQNGESLAAPVAVSFTTGSAASVVTAVRVTPSPLQVAMGEQQPMLATAVDQAGSPLSVSCTWSTSAPAVALISNTGVLSALTPGTSLVHAACGGITGVGTVTVVPMAANLVFTTVTGGYGHNCGLATTGAAYCWGDNSAGQLGAGPTISSATTPIAVDGGLSFAAISAGGSQTCGVTTSGAGYCWGSGYLGDGTTNASPTPVPVAGNLTLAAISVGQWSSCAITTGAAAYCWGYNSDGELGDSSQVYDSAVPVLVAGEHSFAQISVGMGSACGVTTTGAGYCWGHNYFGELGNGTNTGLATSCVVCSNWPVPVAGGLTFQTINHGLLSPCGLTTDGAAYCWGYNSAGELGTGTMTGPEECGLSWDGSPNQCSTVPVAVTAGLTFARLGERGVCGVTTNGAAYCWGDGVATPAPLAGGLTLAMVSAEGVTGCGVTTDGVAYCWGNNDFGQLGNGSHTPSLAPVKVAGQP